MKVSYAIPVCNEHVEIQRLVMFLLKYKQPQDEIIILFDANNGTKEVETYLRSKSVNNDFIWFPYKFEGHFADMKNKLTSHCSGDFIFQIDADEIPNKILMSNLHAIIEANSNVEVYRVPRINTVKHLTPTHIQKWGWNINKEGWVNFPDPQWRIYKNTPNIKWKNKVHEVLEGYKVNSDLPYNEEWCLYHPKTIDRQEKQNDYYDTL
jgi:hypothetical protein